MTHGPRGWKALWKEIASPMAGNAGLILITCALLAASKALAAEGNLATVSVTVQTLGRMIPRDFDGFSIEVDDAAQKYLGPASAPNLVFFQLLKNLGSGTLRIGGDSTDYSCWDSAAAPRPKACRFTITRDVITGYFKASAATGWPLIAGINLAQNNAGWALEYGRELAQTARSVPRATLMAFEFGNEPDLFPTETHARPRDYTWQGLVRDWRAYARAFKSGGETRSIPLAGPAYDDARRAWKDSFLKPFVDGVGAANLGIITVHEYPTNTCHGNTVTISELLSPGIMKAYAARAAGWIVTARNERLPLELGETNSSACGGMRGVDDRMASALWGLDWLFTNARLGFRRINFHMDNAAYSAVFVDRERTAPGIAYANRVSPLYYAMYMFENADHNRLLPARVSTASNIKAYATSACAACSVRVFVINKDLRASGIIAVVPSVRLAQASLLLMRAPSLDSKTVTYGGHSFSNQTGRIEAPQTVTLKPNSSGAYHFELPNASAALLTIARP